MSPYIGTCISCGTTYEDETREGFGDKLIYHHITRDLNLESRGKRCDIFQCQETNKKGEKVGNTFGLDVTMELVTTRGGKIWHQKGRNKEIW